MPTVRKITCVLVKKQLGSRQRPVQKDIGYKSGAYIVSMDKKTTVYGLEAGKSCFFENVYQLSIAMCFRISLACL